MRIRRGRGKKKLCKIYLCNVNGLVSKSASLSIILSSCNPDIVVLCETKATNGYIKKFFQELKYESCIKKGASNSSGGLVIAVKRNFGSPVDVTSSDVHGLMSARLVFRGHPLRIIAAYGPQESVSTDLRELFYENLGVELEGAIISGDTPFVIGDLNAKIIKKNETPLAESANGKLLLDSMETNRLVAINHHTSCRGTWTRVNRKKPQEKAVLDYIFYPSSLIDQVADAVIDEDLLYTPWFKKMCAGSLTNQYTDHNAMLATFNLKTFKDSKKSPSSPISKQWRITENGLAEFKLITEEGPCLFEDDLVALPLQYNSFEDILTGKMEKCFRRIRNKQNNTDTRTTWYESIIPFLQELSTKGKVQREVAKGYLQNIRNIQERKVHELRATKLTGIMTSLSENDCFSSNGFWKLKKAINPKLSNKSYLEVSSDEAILYEYQKEFSKRLAPRPIAPHLKHYQEITNDLVNRLVDYYAANPSEPDFTPDETVKAMRSFSRGSPGTDNIPPEILLHGGQWLAKTLCNFANMFKRNQIVPLQFNHLSITALNKKGSQKLLKNKRGIFLLVVISKLIEKLIKCRIQGDLNKVNIFQAGSRQERGCPDNTFLIKGVIDHAIYINKAVYMNLYDFRQCFDSMWLRDCLLSLWKVGVRNEFLSMIMALNKKASITVKTPSGITQAFETGEIVKQGAVLSSNLCSTSTGEFCSDKTKGGFICGDVKIDSVLYVDDSNVIDEEVRESEESHQVMLQFAEKKGLAFSEEKCFSIIINGKATHTPPNLFIGNHQLELRDLAVILGDVFNKRGDNKDLIADRVSKGMKVLVSCVALCNETTLGIFAVDVLLLLYWIVFLSSVLFNSQSWTRLLQEDIKKLQVIQLKFLKSLLKAPASTPNANVFLDLGVLPIINEIHKRKLAFLHHVLSLDVNDPILRMYHQQISLPFEKNWGNEVSALRKEYGIMLSDTEIKTLSKQSWKSVVKKAIELKTFTELSAVSASKSKTSTLKYTVFQRQGYTRKLSCTAVSTIFRFRTRTLACKVNHKESYANLLCRICATAPESQLHVVNCPAVFQDTNFDVDWVFWDSDFSNHPHINILVSRVERFNEVAKTHGASVVCRVCY